MDIPDNVYQALKDGQSAWHQLVLTVPGNRARWSDEQVRQLALLTDLISQTFNALHRLVMANS